MMGRPFPDALLLEARPDSDGDPTTPRPLTPGLASTASKPGVPTCTSSCGAPDLLHRSATGLLPRVSGIEQVHDHRR